MDEWVPAFAGISSLQQCGLREGEAVEDFVGRNVVHDKDEPAAAVLVRPVVEPFRREHRVLRPLDHCRALRPVGESNEPLHPQKIVAAVLRQPAERAGEIEPAYATVKDDRESSDAMRVRRCLAPPPPRPGRRPSPPPKPRGGSLPPPQAEEGHCCKLLDELPPRFAGEGWGGGAAPPRIEA